MQKIKSFKNFATSLKIGKNGNFKMLAKIKIMESIVYVISELIFLRAGK